MSENITIESLFPAIKDRKLANSIIDIYSTTFVGVDFGTSTTVVTLATIDAETNELTTKAIPLNQMKLDGTIVKSEKIPTVIAFANKKLLIGDGAAELKHRLKKGVNVWHSFKMELGEDLGAKYFNSELDRTSSTPILNPKDAAKVFFMYLKAQIDKYVRDNNLPSHLKFAVSIPASFEANQRKELIYALEQNGISINKQSLIDEPNAAFLSYVQVSSQELEPIKIPEGDNPNLLVFDFGAGTCDVSILELGKDLNGIYSKNLSISKFEKLGGDDIDRYIAAEYLLPKLLEENNKQLADFRTPEKNRMILHLLKAAEQLKILICNAIALQSSNRILPERAISEECISLGYKIEIDTRKGMLTMLEPKLSFQEFNLAMKSFLKSTSLVAYRSKTTSDEYTTIFSPIETALKKADLSKLDIDYVLFIGGSTKNPYVQTALKEYFKESELLIPRDLQTHVSGGAAIHSLVFNGFNKNIIQPITSEPFLVITKDTTPKVLMRAGTQIPCDLIVIDDLVTTEDGQKAIELPICIGNVNKLLYNIKIISDDLNGFKKNTPIRLEIEINSDKLLIARATTEGKEVMVEPINPFSNKELTTEQRLVVVAERNANLEAEKNGGKPTNSSLKSLSEAYSKVGNNLRAAETLELSHEMYPNNLNLNQISLYYSSAGNDEKSLEYANLAYQNNKNSTTAFNLALKNKVVNKDRYVELLEESILLNPNMYHSIYELGRTLHFQGDPKGLEYIEKAFNAWKIRYDSNQLRVDEYTWFSSAALMLGHKELAKEIIATQPKNEVEKLYDYNNLTSSFSEEGIIKK